MAQGEYLHGELKSTEPDPVSGGLCFHHRLRLYWASVAERPVALPPQIKRGKAICRRDVISNNLNRFQVRLAAFAEDARGEADPQASSVTRCSAKHVGAMLQPT